MQASEVSFENVSTSYDGPDAESESTSQTGHSIHKGFFGNRNTPVKEMICKITGEHFYQPYDSTNKDLDRTVLHVMYEPTKADLVPILRLWIKTPEIDSHAFIKSFVPVQNILTVMMGKVGLFVCIRCSPVL